MHEKYFSCWKKDLSQGKIVCFLLKQQQQKNENNEPKKKQKDRQENLALIYIYLIFFQ